MANLRKRCIILLLLIGWLSNVEGSDIEEAKTVHPPTGCVIKTFLHIHWQICPEEPHIPPNKIQIDPSQQVSENDGEYDQDIEKRVLREAIREEEDEPETASNGNGTDVQEMRKKKRRRNKNRKTTTTTTTTPEGPEEEEEGATTERSKKGKKNKGGGGGRMEDDDDKGKKGMGSDEDGTKVLPDGRGEGKQGRNRGKIPTSSSTATPAGPPGDGEQEDGGGLEIGSGGNGKLKGHQRGRSGGSSLSTTLLPGSGRDEEGGNRRGFEDDEGRIGGGGHGGRVGDEHGIEGGATGKGRGGAQHGKAKTTTPSSTTAGMEKREADLPVGKDEKR